MALPDSSQCPAVESIPGKVSRAWVRNKRGETSSRGRGETSSRGLSWSSAAPIVVNAGSSDLVGMQGRSARRRVG